MIFKPLCSPNLDWFEDGRPFNKDTGDCYFSQNPIPESEYVFLKGNDLEKRWNSSNFNQFTIIEMGFGTGLNLLLTWSLWLDKCQKQSSFKNKKLTYISIERSPLTLSDLEKCHSMWPHLENSSRILREQLPAPVPGRHSIILEVNGIKVELLIFYQDVQEALGELIEENIVKSNAWFLDGFSPKLNPSMWSEKTVKKIALLSDKDSCSFSTFSASGAVRRSLQANGFIVNKKKGFGKKREMLIGDFIDVNIVKDNSSSNILTTLNHKKNHKKQALVIGAGLAGCITSAKLAEKGYQVDLVESRSHICQAASGNAAGLAYPKLGNNYQGACAFSLYGFYYLLRELKKYPHTRMKMDGILQLINNSKNSRLSLQTPIKLGLHAPYIESYSEKKLDKVSGYNINKPALFFSHAGWINPENLARNYLDHGFKSNNLQLYVNTKVSKIISSGSSWKIECHSQQQNKLLNKTYQDVIICSGSDVRELLPQYGKCTVPIRGQVDEVEIEHSLSYPICSDGYVIPTSNNSLLVGASFETGIASEIVKQNDSFENLIKLDNIIGKTGLDESSIKQSRCSIRLSSLDRMPMVGAVADETSYAEAYLQLLKRSDNLKSLPLQKGLYINTAHGSHGLVTIPLSSEILARQITGEISPVSIKLLPYLDPQRFIRKLLRKEV